MPHPRKTFSIAVASMLLAVHTVAVASGADSYAGSDRHGPDGLAIVADLAIARPLGLVATVAGAALFIVGLPFAAISGDISTPAHRMVVEPAQYTFSRPLGELSPHHRADGVGAASH